MKIAQFLLNSGSWIGPLTELYLLSTTDSATEQVEVTLNTCDPAAVAQEYSLQTGQKWVAGAEDDDRVVLYKIT